MKVLLILFSFFLTADLSTNLRITVLNNLGNRVEGAKVTVYETQETYEKSENPLFESQLTDKKGRTTFRGLSSTVYFIHAEKGDLNNNNNGIQTDTLTSGRTNKINIIID